MDVTTAPNIDNPVAVITKPNDVTGQNCRKTPRRTASRVRRWRTKRAGSFGRRHAQRHGEARVQRD